MYLHRRPKSGVLRERKRQAQPDALPETAQLDAESAPSFVAEARHQAADAVIARFRDALKRIQTSELERLYDRLPDLEEPSRRAIRECADCLVAKMLHTPLESLREEFRTGSSQSLLEALQRLYRLSD